MGETIVGYVRGLFRYPVKGMAGVPVEAARVGLHGLEGDRRYGFRRVGERGGFPWLNANRLLNMGLYVPFRREAPGQRADPEAAAGVSAAHGAIPKPANAGVVLPEEAELLPTHVRTPSGEELELAGDALREELSAGWGSAVELMQLKQGIFDDADVSIITTATLASLAREAGVADAVASGSESADPGAGDSGASGPSAGASGADDSGAGEPSPTLDVRRFRPNILIEAVAREAFPEDAWIGALLAFGEAWTLGGADEAHATGPTIAVQQPDVRCMAINLDPITAAQDPKVLKAAVRLNANNAGVYCAVARPGVIHLGDPVRLVRV